MKRMILILAAVSLVAISCNKEELNNVSKTRPVTLNVGIGSETKVSHEYSDSKVKPTWESGDVVYVQFEKNGTPRLEEFTISEIADGGKSASFINSASELTDDIDYTVIYATPDLTEIEGTDLTFNLKGQNGSLTNLPEYLEAEVAAGETSAALVSKLTYFHFVLTLKNLNNYDHISDFQFGAWNGSSFESEYIGLTNTGESSVQSIDINNPSATLDNTIDMYIAAFLIRQANAYNVKVTMAKEHGASAHEYHYSWNPKDGKEYIAGKVYKVAGTLVKK